MNKNQSKEEILKVVNECISSVSKDKEEIESLASSKGFNGLYSAINEPTEITKRLRKHYNFMVLNDLSFQWGFKSNNENLVNEIYNLQFNKEYYFLRKIGFKSIDIKKQIVRINKSDAYYLNYLKEVFNIDYEKVNIKEYVNGNLDFKFTSEEVFNKFKNIVEFFNPETEAVLNAITEADKTKLKELKKQKYNNIYNVIWDIKKRVGLEDKHVYLNYYVIFQRLESV